MDIILDNLKELSTNFYHSSTFSMIKIFLSIYVIVLIIDIFLIIFARGTGADIRTIMRGVDIPAGSKGKMTKRWQRIVQRLESEDDSQYKAAILEAHTFIDEILKGIGHKGKNMAERLEQAKPGQLDNIDDLWRAHKIRNQIIKENDFQVDSHLAREIVEIYEDLLRSLEFI